MPGVIPFQTLSNAGRPAPGQLTIALGAEFATPDAAALDAAVARIAADLAPLAGGPRGRSQGLVVDRSRPVGRAMATNVTLRIYDSESVCL